MSQRKSFQSSYNINGVHVRLIFDEGLNESDEYGTRIAGETEYVEEHIKLNPAIAESKLIKVFYHELVHYILSSSGVSDLLSDKQEEAIASALGHGMAYFVSKNKSIPKWKKSR